MSHLKPLPSALKFPLESLAILRQAASAHRYLAELKGAAKSIPNESILINTVALREAKDSSAIENIVTTEDDLFQSDFASSSFATPSAKEVHHYSEALFYGWTRLRKEKVLRLKDLLTVHSKLVGNDSGLRKLPGTVLKNQRGETVYEPPQDPEDVKRLIANFLDYFNASDFEGIDPLVRMAILHYQFESIHPFYDGNGRAGRILNLLYLVEHGLLHLPILYLSSYIVRTKADYYQGLQAVRTHASWEPWILYLLRGVDETSRETLTKVERIRDLMQFVKIQLRQKLPRLYSQDLLNTLFRHPYTKIEFIERDLHKTRQTAAKYLEALTRAGFVRKNRAGRNNYYINDRLVEVLSG